MHEHAPPYPDHHAVAQASASLGPASSIEQVCWNILAILQACRRTCPGEVPGEAVAHVARVQLPRIRWFVERGMPLQMVLPAFPAKSPSPHKVMGRLPDLAERLALGFLQQLCARIASCHLPGAQVIVCSDGHVFGDAIGCSDADIEMYRAAVSDIIAEQGSGALSLFSLGDWADAAACGSADHDARRALLLRGYGQSLGEVRQRLLRSSAGRRQYAGISRFMEEDAGVRATGISRTAQRRRAKQAALQVVQRSWAWGALLADLHPQALRLSIHPHQAGSIKFGIHLCDTRDAWMTPWHGVALSNGHQYVLVKRGQAQALGARPVAVGTVHAHYLHEGLDLAALSAGTSLAHATVPPHVAEGVR